MSNVNTTAGKTSRKSAKAARKPAARRVAGKAAATSGKAGSASRLIDGRIKELGDWRGTTLQRVRDIIREADPDMVEEWKWETPVWSHGGLVCTGETYK